MNDAYSKIYNPVSKRNVSIRSKIGKKILMNYLNQIRINQQGGVFTPERVMKKLLELSCSITDELMVDPVNIESGESYERNAIIEWFSVGNNTCPLTRKPVDPTIMVSNSTLQRQIRNYIEKLKTKFDEKTNGNEWDEIKKTIAIYENNIRKQREDEQEEFRRQSLEDMLEDELDNKQAEKLLDLRKKIDK